MRDEELIKGRWTYLGLTSEVGLTPGFRKALDETYQSVMFLPNHDYERITAEPLFDILVRGYEKPPKHLDPGGGFLIVKTLSKGEHFTPEIKAQLTKNLCQNESNCEVDLIVREGPAFLPAKGLQNQLIRDPNAERVVWARWRFSKDEDKTQ